MKEHSFLSQFLSNVSKTIASEMRHWKALRLNQHRLYWSIQNCRVALCGTITHKDGLLCAGVTLTPQPPLPERERGSRSPLI